MDYINTYKYIYNVDDAQSIYVDWINKRLFIFRIKFTPRNAYNRQVCIYAFYLLNLA